MQQTIRKQAEQRDRIGGMKQEESRPQRQLVEKVQKDREREQRMQELLKQSMGLEEFLKKASMHLPTVAKEEILPTGVQWNNDHSEEAELRKIEQERRCEDKRRFADERRHEAQWKLDEERRKEAERIAEDRRHKAQWKLDEERTREAKRIADDRRHESHWKLHEERRREAERIAEEDRRRESHWKLDEERRRKAERIVEEDRRSEARWKLDEERTREAERLAVEDRKRDAQRRYGEERKRDTKIKQNEDRRRGTERKFGVDTRFEYETQETDRKVMEEILLRTDGQSFGIGEEEKLKNERELLLQRQCQLQQQKAKEEKPIQSAKKVEFRDKYQIEESVKFVETTEPKTQREVELDRKESYLKQLGEELNRKEESLRARVLETPSANSVPVETVKKVDVTHFIKSYIHTFSGTVPLPKNESSFETWKLEIECLKKTQAYLDFVITQAIRNSLKGHARNVLFTMSSTATSQNIIDKLESILVMSHVEKVLCKNFILQLRRKMKVSRCGD